MSSKPIENILKQAKVIAVVGLSRNPTKDSHSVALYLQRQGYRIIPVNPFAKEILGEKCYPSLRGMSAGLQSVIDLVDIFRPSEEVSSIVDDLIMLRKKNGKPDVVWMQLGIIDEEAAGRARTAGLQVIMNRCTRTEHGILFS